MAGVFTQHVIFLFCIRLLLVRCQTKLNDDSVETETTCENISSTCFPSLTESYVTESNGLSVENDLTSVPTKATAITTENSTPSSPISNVSIQPVSSKPSTKNDKSVSGKYCHCDINPDFCDVNCCCDTDCKDWERAAFSSCIESGPNPSYGQCVSTDIIYKNNTPYPTTRNDGGLLCIAKDNFPERNSYIDQEVIKTIQTFEKVWARKKHYYWTPLSEKLLKKIEKNEIYKFGEPIWKYNNITEEAFTFDIPANIGPASSVCKRKKPIFYLSNIKTTCLQIVPTDEIECIESDLLNANNYCQNIVIISSPSLLNSTEHISDSPDEALIKVKQLLCEGDNCSETISYPAPTFDKEKQSCHNSLLKFKLEVRHNGSLGITEAVCKITLGSPTTFQGLFEQKFEVEFLSSYLNTSLTFQRSGTPGYRDNLPVITRILQKDKTMVKTNLTVISGENCMKFSPVLFRENARIQCMVRMPIKSTLNCSSLDDLIINKMLHGIGEIGVTGDPASWLEPAFPLVATPLSSSVCTPVSHLSLRFLYAYSGPLLKPEAKIIGFLMKFDRAQPPICSNHTQFCTIRLVTTTSFTDVSKPVVSKYASAPVVKIKLPQDFFYPFSSHADRNYKFVNNIMLTFLIFMAHIFLSYLV